MSDCEYCHNKNNDGVDAAAAKKPIGDGLIITTAACHGCPNFFWSKNGRNEAT